MDAILDRVVFEQTSPQRSKRGVMISFRHASCELLPDLTMAGSDVANAVWSYPAAEARCGLQSLFRTEGPSTIGAAVAA